MSRPTCSRCGTHLPARARRDAKFCSTRCRVAAHRTSPIPLEMRQRPRWVRHTAAKVPLTVEGDTASSVDPMTWSTYQAAQKSDAGVGLGFVLNGDGLVCLDLDHCLTAGSLDAAVAALLDALPATYIEVSPGGDGLHVWLRGSLSRDGVQWVHGVRCEAYSRDRYITVTGRRWSDSPSRIAAVGGLVVE